ncbi:hypothetical protein [Streptomyces sp. NPDC053560]|uniref:hypothetical protein n=1 Tax=Streptomyces sp. NPDC053560 TaxID=3365711 RepID=UPI0037D72CFA
MRRNVLRLGALFTALFLACAPTVLEGGPTVAAAPSPGPAHSYKLLVKPGVAPTGKDLDSIARKVIQDPMGQELHLAVERFKLLPVRPPNTSVAFFDFGWMVNSPDLPGWLKDSYPHFLGEFTDEVRSPSTAPSWKYPLHGRMLDAENYFYDDLFEELGVRPTDSYGNDQVLALATGSRGDNRHSEDAMDEFMSRTLDEALRRTARTPAQVQETAKIIRVIKGHSGAGIAGQRSYCNDCAPKVSKAGYKFRNELFIVKFDKRGSPQAKLANSTLKQLPVKLAKEYKKQDEKAATEAVNKVGLTSSCPLGGTAQTMDLAALSRSAPCGGDKSGLAGALSSSDYGGVDFSTLQLRYLSDDADSGVRYAFSAKAAEKGLEQDSRSGRSSLIGSMADLRTWLVLSPDTFWVNLNPAEPDRIIDSALGRTNAGRALLEADWRMKRTQGKLLDPGTSFGAEYWRKLGGSGGRSCYSSRMWIVPGKVEVREDGSSLYVLKAALDVKAKAEKVAGLGRSGCNADPAETARNERLEQEMVVPKIAKAVNTDPEYAALRQAFLARVVAQWILDRHAAGHTTSFDKLIGSGDLGPATLDGSWEPKQVYSDYVRSISEGDFTYRRTTRVGNKIITYVMRTGGVDFSRLRPDKLSSAEMGRQVPQLPRTVRQSADRPTTAADGSVWLADSAAPPHIGTWERIRGFLGGTTGILVVVVVALAILLLFVRDGSALRRKVTE